jgi:hypothetical protein
MTSHYTLGSIPTLHDFDDVFWDIVWTLFHGLSQFHGHGSWLVCEMALILLVVHFVGNTTHFLNIMCTLVATNMMLQSLEGICLAHAMVS